MGEILPDGSMGGYSNVCAKCKKTISVNAQGYELGVHECIEENEVLTQYDVLDELKPRVEEVLTQFKEGTIDSATAWKDIREQLVNAYDFGNDILGNVDDGMDRFSISDIIKELDERKMFSDDVSVLQTIVLKYMGNPLIPENLMDELKLKAVSEAMKKYTLTELEKRLA